MKKAIVSLLVILGFTFNIVLAQAPAGYESGSVVLANNTKLDGFVKESLASKGSLSFAATTGSKKTYSVSELNGFNLKSDNYIVYSNDFYKTIAAGTKVILYQKQSNNSGKLLYNGSDAFTATTTAGNIGDYYIKLNNSDDLLLVNAKNFETVISKEFASCNTIIADIKSKQLDFAQLSKVVEKFNNCK
jgi:hypothetical protein